MREGECKFRHPDGNGVDKRDVERATLKDGKTVRVADEDGKTDEFGEDGKTDEFSDDGGHQQVVEGEGAMHHPQGECDVRENKPELLPADERESLEEVMPVAAAGNVGEDGGCESASVDMKTRFYEVVVVSVRFFDFFFVFLCISRFLCFRQFFL